MNFLSGNWKSLAFWPFPSKNLRTKSYCQNMVFFCLFNDQTKPKNETYTRATTIETVTACYEITFEQGERVTQRKREKIYKQNRTKHNNKTEEKRTETETLNENNCTKEERKKSVWFISVFCWLLLLLFAELCTHSDNERDGALLKMN